jgi:predicted AlkP superfamily pyrophosphatase or phosphodiesterase
MRRTRSRVALGLALVLALGCRSGAPPAGVGGQPGTAAANSPAAAATAARAAGHRVILISLDGAGSETLHELYRQGALDRGGFARFFAEGEVADAMVPVNPSLTATNHISLATGFPAAATGIVGNDFHLPGDAPLDETVSGFEAPIGTETLWEAARRQGRRVGVLAWPGADTADERRTADWGLTYGQPNTAPRVVDLARDEWLPPAPTATGAPSRVRIAARPSAILPVGILNDGPPAQSLEILAAATPGAATGGASGFDAVEVSGLPRAAPAVGAVPGSAAAPEAPPDGGTSGAAAPVEVGAWARAAWPRPQSDGPAALWVKLLALSPDLAAARLYVGSLFHTSAYPAAYGAALTAAGLFWPGGPDSSSLQASWQGKPGIDLATWHEQAQRLTDFIGGAVRQAVARGDWDLLMAYLSVIDDSGHRLLLVDPRQSGFTPALRDELALERLRVWQAVDEQLARLLAHLDLAHTTLIVVSDHGMAPVHTTIDPNAPLAAMGVLLAKPGGAAAAGAAAAAPPGATAGAPGSAAPSPAPAPPASPAPRPATPRAYAVANGGMAHVYVDAGGDAAARKRLLAELAARYLAWQVNGEKPVEEALTREEAARLGLDNPASGDLILFARHGYQFRALSKGKESAPSQAYGAHGYLNSYADMQASFLAIGAGITPHRGGTIQATDVARRVAALLGIAPPRREPPPPARPETPAPVPAPGGTGR